MVVYGQGGDEAEDVESVHGVAVAVAVEVGVGEAGGIGAEGSDVAEDSERVGGGEGGVAVGVAGCGCQASVLRSSFESLRMSGKGCCRRRGGGAGRGGDQGDREHGEADQRGREGTHLIE